MRWRTVHQHPTEEQRGGTGQESHQPHAEKTPPEVA